MRKSILRNGRINLFAPRQNAADHVFKIRETLRLETIEGVGTALARATLQDNLSVRVEFIGAGFDLSERDQACAGNASYLPFIGFADINYRECLARVHTCLELLDGNLFGVVHGFCRSLFAAYAAKFLVVNQFGNCRIFAADGTFRVFFEP